MSGTQADALAELRERVGRYPPARYPVQHATAQFHLGATLTELGDIEAAVAALSRAVELFDPALLPAEHATAANALGVARRTQGRLDAAAEAFRRAQDGFERAARGPERAAALHNLGLVEMQRGRPQAAAGCFEQALRAFAGAHQPAGAAASSRELGAAQLAAGELDAAAATLTEACDRSEQTGNPAGVGAASNLLGLVHLASGRTGDAVEAFRRSAAANPRRVRPEGYAVAKANLALAYQRAGDSLRARFAAGQALAVPGIAEAARAVALEAAGGTEPVPGALGELMAAEDAEVWPGLARDELGRWLDLGRGALDAEAEAWVEALVARPDQAAGKLAAWFGVLLELPTQSMTALLRPVLAALGHREPAEQERFRRTSARAMASFAVPQLMRLHDTIEGLAVEVGLAGSWR